MSREMLNKFINQLFVIDGLICVVAYVMRSSNARLMWVLLIALGVLFWLVVAKVMMRLDSRFHRIS